MRTLKVVIADDEVRICQLIQALVNWEEMGMEIAGTANNGIDACEVIEKVCPDILITDIRMPGCSGLELIEKIKKTKPELEIIIISGYAHFEYAQQAIRYGVGYYLLKPINKVELMGILEKLKNKIGERIDSEQNRQELLRQAQLQKSIFEPVSFSMSVGMPVTGTRKLGESVQEALKLIPERMVKGSGRLLENLGELSSLKEENLLEKYLREITIAVEVMSAEQADAAVIYLQNETRKIKNIHGYELLELIGAVADLFAACVQMQERSRNLELFKNSAESVQVQKSFSDAFLIFSADLLWKWPRSTKMIQSAL